MIKRFLLLAISCWLLAVVPEQLVLNRVYPEYPKGKEWIGTLYAYKKTSIDITINGTQRNMVVFTPNTFGDNVPLMIITHGMNQDPEYQYGSDKMYELIDTAKFVVVYPRSNGTMWDTGGEGDKNFIIRVISEMHNRYSIDTNRVYWSGFSMGSMLIYHCMPTMTDRIAAFAPTSGIQFSEQPWNNLKKHVNLIECTAYGDDVFGYEEYGMRNYVLNIANKNGYTKYTKKSGYRTKNGTAWFDGLRELWKNEDDGSEVVLFSFNNGGHWPMAENSYEIWNFCKRFSLDPGIPSVTIESPDPNVTYTSVDTIAVRVKATDQDGYINSIKLYVDGSLKKTETFTEKTADNSYILSFQWVRPLAKNHILKVIAVDNDGKKKEISKTFTINSPDPLTLLKADPEDESFDLPLTWKHFQYDFDWRVDITKINAYLAGNDTITLIPTMLCHTSDTDSLTKNLVLLIPEDKTPSEGSYKLWIKDVIDERMVRASNMIFRYTFGVEEVDPYNPNPKTPAEIYKGGFLRTYAEGQALYDSTSVEKYQVAESLREPLKVMLDTYKDFASTSPSEYKKATDTLRYTMDALNVRVHDLDSLYDVIDEANELLEQYKDDPVISAKDIYSKLQKCIEMYSQPKKLQTQTNIYRAITSVKSYITRFKAAIVTGIHTISEVSSDGFGNLRGQVRSYNLSGQAVGGNYKGIVIRDGKKFIQK